ncbi:MAG: hypothetical protein GY722_15855 [bacterium]|nr:hypothetical protein [bacterium]
MVILVGVLLAFYGPTLSVRPIRGPIVTRAVGILGLIGGVHEIYLAWPSISRWNQAPFNVDSSGASLLAVRRPPRRIEWEDVAAIDPDKTEVAISLKDGVVLTLHADVILMNDRRVSANDVADYLATEFERGRQ